MDVGGCKNNEGWGQDFGDLNSLAYLTKKNEMPGSVPISSTNKYSYIYSTANIIFHFHLSMRTLLSL